MNTRIYCVFPACGKTWLYKHQKEYGVKILDSDSSEFSWLYIDTDEFGEPLEGYRKIRNPDFPNNYIQHIKENIGKYDYIFVSSHAEVRNTLDADGIDFTIVYPDKSLKGEWIGRCYMRELGGESGCNATIMYENYDKWIDECIEVSKTHEYIVLDSCKHLSDYLWGVKNND